MYNTVFKSKLKLGQKSPEKFAHLKWPQGVTHNKTKNVYGFSLQNSKTEKREERERERDRDRDSSSFFSIILS